MHMPLPLSTRDVPVAGPPGTALSLRRRLAGLEAVVVTVGSGTTPAAVPPAPVRTPADLVAGLAAVALRAMEQAETEARLEAVERALKLRADAAKQAKQTKQAERSKPHGYER